MARYVLTAYDNEDVELTTEVFTDEDAAVVRLKTLRSRYPTVEYAGVMDVRTNELVDFDYYGADS